MELENKKKENKNRPFYCKTSHSDNFLYAQVAMTAAFAIIGIVLMSLKRWKFAYIFISSAVFTGISANTTLQIRLNTDSCKNKTKRILYGVCSLFTLTALVSWAVLSLDLVKLVDLEAGSKSTHVTTVQKHKHSSHHHRH